MSNSTVLSTDRSSSRRRFRAPIAAASAAVLGLSLLLSVAPALGAANNGNGNGGGNGGGDSSSTSSHGTSGNVKVHDSATGVETSGTDNEPHVCAFWLEFTFDAPFESGTWVLVTWAPTGDGSTVASGVYDTAGDGVDSSNIIELAAGHYGVEWAATSATSSKKKTFWVDAGCNQPASPAEESQAEDPAPPTDAPGSPAEESQTEESQTEESQAEDPAPPTDAPGSPAEESQTEGSQAEDPAPPTDAPGSPAEESQTEGSQTEELVLGGQETAPEDEDSHAEDVAPTDEEEAPPAEEPADEDVTAPDNEITPPADEEVPPVDASGDEEPAQTEDPGSTDPGTLPDEDELGGTGGADEPTMPDTATPTVPVQSGLLATMGLLALIAAHATARRNGRLDREIADPRS